jgi:hypothetical protein
MPVGQVSSTGIGSDVWDARSKRYISACEGGFRGVVDWPSNGGTREQASNVLNTLEGQDTSQVLILGLRKYQDQTLDPSVRCCEYHGWITGILGIVGPDEAVSDRYWQRLTELENASPGYYSISYPNVWLILL